MENMNDNSSNETESEKPAEVNFAEMSDEEILNFDPTSEVGSDENADDDSSDESPGSEEDAGQASEATGGAGTDDPSSESEEGGDSTSGEEDDDKGNAEATSETEADPFKDDQSKNQGKSETEGKKDATDDIDYKAEFERVLEPFKASGRTVTPKSVEELRRLAQMGYDYGNKMAAMKPVQRLVATLEKHELTDLDDLSYLIDLKKGNPEAIKKLIKESNIDPMDLSDDEGGPYRPTDHSVSDSEAEMADVIKGIEDTPSFKSTLQHISKMDTGSKETLQANPGVIAVLNEHVEAGVYDQITQEVSHQRAIGELKGLSDLEAYKQVGDAMQAAGAFDKLKPQTPSSSPGKSQRSAQDSGSQSSDKEESLRNRKRAATPPKGKANAGKKKIDLSRLTDKEIENLDPSTL